MNRLLLLLTLSLFTTTGYSQVGRWFHQPANCFINAGQASCQVTNFRFAPIFCEARASARTYFGFTLTSFFRGWIQPRQSAFVVVRANNPFRDPIVNTNAWARCLF